MRSRATCILLIEVWVTLHRYFILYKYWSIFSLFLFFYNLYLLMLQIFWALGTVFEVLLAILVMPTLGWRWLLGLSTIPLFIFAILCYVSIIVLTGYTASAFFPLHFTCLFLGVYVISVASRECSIWCADGKPGKSSGHTEAHCHGERSPYASGETNCCQTGTAQSVSTRNTCSECNLDMTHVWCPHALIIYFYAMLKQEDRGKIQDLFSSHFRCTTVLLWFIW